jgi:hypothetical protein
MEFFSHMSTIVKHSEVIETCEFDFPGLIKTTANSNINQYKNVCWRH